MNENSSITYNNVNNITYQGTQAQGGTFIYNRAIGEIAGGFLGGAVEKDISKTIVKNGSNSIYQNYAEKATKNANSTSVMLGKYNQDGISYIKAAGNKHTYFDLGDRVWNEAVNKVGEPNMWEINKKFLE